MPEPGRRPALRAALMALAATGLLSGCSTLDGLGYYGQSIGGHLRILAAARPVPEVMADAATPAELRERLALTQRLRDFAVQELGLPDNATYRRYAELGRSAPVWNVVAAPELSLKLRTWCFPVVGCVGYRGYYAEADARAFSEPLAAAGDEVMVYAVPAYSTLGRLPDWAWTSDPLLSSFVRWPESELARLIFHELSHQVAFARDDITFNESYATAVERLGARHWLALHGSDAVRDEARRIEARRADFRALTQRTRERLRAVYDGPGSDDDKRRAKAEVMAGLRTEHQALKRERWGGFAGYDEWIARANNASFGVQAAYDELVPAFEALYERVPAPQGATALRFKAFHAEVRRIAALPDAAARRAALPRP